jgi:hypothetical protein
MLYWNKKQFSKTFSSADLGLLECLFNSGYTWLSAFTSHLAPFYNDKIHWTFASNVKDTDLASDDNGDVIVTVDSEGGVSFALPATVDNVVSFMRGMKPQYNDSNGTHDIVTFLDIDYVDDMQMVCLIQQSDDTELLVVLEMLNFIENPDIASILQTNKEFHEECHYLDPSDLEKIVHPQVLSPLQEEMMSHHCHLHHTSFPKLIVMAEQGKIPKHLHVVLVWHCIQMSMENQIQNKSSHSKGIRCVSWCQSFDRSTCLCTTRTYFSD